MGLTRTIVDQSAGLERFKVRIADFQFDNSYATGGEALAPADLGLSAFRFVMLEEDADGYVVKFDRANNKLMLFVEEAVAAGGPLLEVAAATDVSAVVVRVLAIGI